MNQLAASALLVLTAASLIGCGDSGPEERSTESKSSKIFVADEDDGTISVLDHETTQRTAIIELPMDGDMYMPHNVQTAPDGKSVWVAAPPMAHGGVERLFVVDPETNAVMGSVDLGADLHVAHVVLDPSSSYAYVTANEANSVVEIDAHARIVTRTIDLGPSTGPHGARFCGQALWVAAMEAKALIRIDPATGTIRKIDVGGVAVQTGCTSDGRFVLASLYDTKEVIRYDLQSDELVRIALPAEAQGPVQLYPSPDSKFVWVCDQGMLEGRPASNKLYRIDIAAASLLDAIEVGQGAHGVVVSEDGRRVFVTNVVDSSVSVVDADTLKSVATVPVGKRPNGISHWHVTGGMP